MRLGQYNHLTAFAVEVQVEQAAIVAEEESFAEVVGGGEGGVDGSLAAESEFVEEAVFAAHEFYALGLFPAFRYLSGGVCN